MNPVSSLYRQIRFHSRLHLEIPNFTDNGVLHLLIQEFNLFKIEPPIITEIQLIMQSLRESTDKMDTEDSYYTDNDSDSDDNNVDDNDNDDSYYTDNDSDSDSDDNNVDDIPNEVSKKPSKKPSKKVSKKVSKKPSKKFMQFWGCDDIELALPVFALPNRELYEDDYEDDSRLILPTVPTRELYEDDYEDDSRLILPTVPTRELYEDDYEDDSRIILPTVPTRELYENEYEDDNSIDDSEDMESTQPFEYNEDDNSIDDSEDRELLQPFEYNDNTSKNTKMKESLEYNQDGYDSTTFDEEKIIPLFLSQMRKIIEHTDDTKTLDNTMNKFKNIVLGLYSHLDTTLDVYILCVELFKKLKKKNDITDQTIIFLEMAYMLKNCYKYFIVAHENIKSNIFYYIEDLVEKLIDTELKNDRINYIEILKQLEEVGSTNSNNIEFSLWYKILIFLFFVMLIGFYYVGLN
jgi:hypothetical protein